MNDLLVMSNSFQEYGEPFQLIRDTICSLFGMKYYIFPLKINIKLYQTAYAQEFFLEEYTEFNIVNIIDF